jgi:hypothetical protein
MIESNGRWGGLSVNTVFRLKNLTAFDYTFESLQAARRNDGMAKHMTEARKISVLVDVVGLGIQRTAS